MAYFQDMLLLLFFGLSAVFFNDIRLSLVLAFSLSLILCCSCYFVESPRIRLGLIWIFLASGALCPEAFYFYPAAVYLLLREKQRLTALFGTLAALSFGIPQNTREPLAGYLCFIAFAAAFLLACRTGSYQELLLQLHHTRDDSQEYALLLSQKNKALVEKQDSEIHTATLRERNRIAREIHDNVGHVLSRSILMVGALRAVNTQESLSPMLENLDASLNSAMDSIRASVHDLHDESVNLEERIRAIVRDFTFCPAELTFDMGSELPKEIKYAFISITQEAFSNIIRHSSATLVQVLMREHPALYQLCIEDNGSPGQSASPDGQGMGLSNMKERILALGGTFQVLRENGFKIFITVPKKERIFHT